MKIVVTTGIYPPDIGGPATYSKLLNDQLPIRGHYVSVLSFGKYLKYPKGIRHVFFFFSVLFRAFSADAVIAVDTVSVGFPTMLATKILAKKFFVRVPGDYAWEQATQRYGVTESIDDFQNKKYGRGVEFLRKIQTMTVNGACKLIAPSQYFKKIVSNWVKNSQKVFCIYNGIDLSDISDSQSTSKGQDFPNNQNFQYQPKTIISAGRLVPWKGFSALIEMMKLLPDWRLSIAGDGPLKSELEKTIAENNLSQRVFLLGQIPRQQLVEKIRQSDVFVLNTSFESFSFQIVEAMAIGTPVVATRIGNLAEIIDDQQNGLLVKPNDQKAIVDSVVKLSNDLNFRKQIVESAKIKAKNFSIDKTISQLIDLIQKP